MSIAIEVDREAGIEVGRRTWNLAERIGSGLQKVAVAFVRGSERLISQIKPLDRWLNTIETTVPCMVEELHRNKFFLIAELGTRSAQGLEIRPNSYLARVTRIKKRLGFFHPWQDEVTIRGFNNGAVRKRLTEGFLISFKNS